MEYNGNDQSQSLEFSVILYVKTYDKRVDVQLSNFQPFHEAEAYGKIAAHNSSNSRSPCLQENYKSTVYRGVCVTSIYCLDSSFFCSSKIGSIARYHRTQLL